jgi:hypothetical protein
MSQHPIEDRRQDHGKLIHDIVLALQAAQPPQVCLSEEEQQWVRLVIRQQLDRAKVRQAIIEKTLAGLAWSVIVGVGYLLLDWFNRHGGRGS